MNAAAHIGARLLVAWLSVSFATAQVPTVTETNVTIRIIAANLSSGNYQRYESPGLNILKGINPDIVAIQEFNYASTNGRGTSTPAAFREMIDTAFGTNFVYFRESSATETYSIPNGIISRFPILAAGAWDDAQIPDRGFAWAQIDIPGTNPLYVVSVHLKASSGSASTRATEATNLKALIQSSFPVYAFVVVAGDLNISSPGETALATFKTFLSDNPIPTDAASGGDADTNLGRTQRYDYVLPSFGLADLETPVAFASHSFPSGLILDSRVYSPLSDVSPVQAGDSAAVNMQHMAVIKDFSIRYTVTNSLSEPPLITKQPRSQVVAQGENASFEVAASGAAPLSFQWRFGLSIIPGATTSSYIRTNVQAADLGNYSVLATNPKGTSISSNAMLSLLVPPPLLSMPASGVIRWEGLSNLSYTVQSKKVLEEPDWSALGSASSPTRVIMYTNQPGSAQNFFRVVYP